MPAPFQVRYLPTVAALLFALACAPGVVPQAAASVTDPAHKCRGELKLTGRVVDAANVLPAAVHARLTVTLASWEARTRHQFVVVTVPSLGGSDIALYSVRLFRCWGIGRRGVNDGMGLLIAPSERRLRIEVGSGLERALPDEVAARIIREQAVPRFRAGDLPGGTEATVGAAIASIDAAERRRAQRPH